MLELEELPGTELPAMTALSGSMAALLTGRAGLFLVSIPNAALLMSVTDNSI